MNETIDGERVKLLRARLNLTQDALAKKARVSKGSIYRIENGRQSGARQGLRDALAAALGVTMKVLTGELPLPSDPAADEPEARLFEMFSLNHRVGGGIRNAYTLTALRYGIPIARIIELAPALFVMAAEASLNSRRANLEQLSELHDRLKGLRDNFAHLPENLLATHSSDDAFVAEEESIERRDIIATGLPDSIFYDSGSIKGVYDEDEHNPFIAHLQSQAKGFGEDVFIERFSHSDTTLHVCRADALELAGGDPDLADAILSGQVVLFRMPRELFAPAAREARVAWLTERNEEFGQELLNSISSEEVHDRNSDVPSNGSADNASNEEGQ